MVRTDRGRSTFDQLDDYTAVLQSQRDTSDYVKCTKAYVSAILTCCGFVFPAHVDVGAVAKWLNSLQSSGPKVELPAGFTGFAVKEVVERLGISTDAVADHVTVVLAYQGVVLGDGVRRPALWSCSATAPRE